MSETQYVLVLRSDFEQLRIAKDYGPAAYLADAARRLVFNAKYATDEERTALIEECIDSHLVFADENERGGNDSTDLVTLEPIWALRAAYIDAHAAYTTKPLDADSPDPELHEFVAARDELVAALREAVRR